jgi:hypothetical protein
MHQDNPEIGAAFGPPLVYDALGVARALGLTFEQQFTTRRRRLEKHGFPRPLPMTPLRWSREAVNAWIASHHRPTTPAAVDVERVTDKRNPVIVALENYGRVA